MQKTLLIVALVLILAAVGASAYFYLQAEEEAKRIEILEKEIEGLAIEKAAVSKKIKEIKVEKKTLTSQLQQYSDKLQKIEKDITTIEQEKNRLVKEFSEKESLVSQLQTRLDSVVSQETQLRSQLDSARSEFKNINDKIEDTRREKIALEEELKKRLQGPKGVELKRIVVKVTPDLEGEILETNGEYNFSIIDLGMAEGVRSGDIVAIYRDGEFIAKAVVENVYEDMSSVIVFEEWVHLRILVGDKIKLIKS